MENLGEYLRNQREERGILIEELAARTRIPLRFLHAIEKNQFEKIPNQVSAKGFLRSYVRYLGVEEEAVLEAFSKIVQAQRPLQKLKDNDEFLSYLHENTPSQHPFSRKIVFSIGGVIVILLVLAGLLREGSFNRNKKVPAEVTDVKENEITESSSAPATEFLRTDEELPEKAEALPIENKTLSSIPDPKDQTPEIKERLFTLSLKALEASWVQVILDGSETKEALLQVGDVVKWHANEKFFLTLGNAGGVQVLLNEQDLGSFGPSGEVVEKEIIGSTTIRDGHRNE